MDAPFPEPTRAASSRADVLGLYLDYFRDRVAAKLEGIPESHRRSSLLPSGWTPVQLLKHLTHVEHRWLEWGFEGRPVANPWADQRDGRWYAADDETLTDLLAAFRAQVRRSDAVVAAHGLDEVGQPGERWNGEPPATLERVLLHLVQEYARHLGHLDVVAELCGGPVGE
ncbi:MAG: DinB family protein [Terracoccus sp.]